ncbi:BamA/TamA family outer membrane protein, partial [Escherichia coli]|uniref:BamA/TamA family outer membrane protein n=2 Tax=Gammaproteobacteria TaxID=1236 RepID=UPI001EDB4631
VNNYVTDSFGGSLSFGYPIDENQSLSASLGIDSTKVKTGPYVSTYVRDYLLANGGKTTGASTYCTVDLTEANNFTCPAGSTVTYD